MSQVRITAKGSGLFFVAQSKMKTIEYLAELKRDAQLLMSELAQVKTLCVRAADALENEATQQETHYWDLLIVELRKAAE